MAPADGEHRDKPPGPGTTAVHGGESPPFWGESLLPPIAQTSTFVFERVADLIAFKEGQLEHPEYGRYGNPTVRIVERKLAALEGAEDCLLVGSGMAAISVVATTVLQQGCHVLMTKDMYPGTRALFDMVLPRFGISYSVVPPGDLGAVAAEITPETSLLFAEVPTNPHLQLPDLAALLALAKERRLTTVIDATLATPLLCRPLEHGADLVVHSGTKFLGGHNDLLSGAVLGPAPMIEALRETSGLLGTVPGPMDAWLLNRGIKSLAVRMKRHSTSAAVLAERLADHPGVEQVFYPGVGDGAPAELRDRYLADGAGGLVSFRPKGGDAAAQALIDALELFNHAGSLGGAESLVQIPYLFTMYELGPEGAAERGMETDLIRLSVGLEDVEDLWADLASALAAIGV